MTPRGVLDPGGDTAQVDGHGEVELVEIERGDRTDGTDDAGVVEHHIETAEGRHREVDGRRYGRLVGHIGDDETARRAEFVDEGPTPLVLDLGDDHAGALGNEPAGGGGTESAPGAGDDGYPPGQAARAHRPAPALRMAAPHPSRASTRRSMVMCLV